MKRFGLLQPYFGELSCMPVVCMTREGCLQLESVFKKLFPFVINQQGVPWLHGYGRNARILAK